MTLGDWLIFGLITLAGLALSALFSGMETGLYTINRVRLAVQAERGRPSAAALRKMLANPTHTLATILVANNIANYTASFGLAEILNLAGFSPGRAILINAAILIPLLFVVGEILPKDLFRTHTDRWSYFCAPFLKVVMVVLTWTGLVPVVRQVGMLAARLFGGDPTANLTARQRVSRLIREGMGAGVLSALQTTLADRSMILRDRSVRNEMIPFHRVASIDSTADRAAHVTTMRRMNFTRFPVVDGSGAVIGVLSLIDFLLQPDAPIDQLMTPPMFLAETTLVHDAIQAMRDRKVAMVVVTDANSKPVGLVTLKDLVEPLTGELTVW